MGDEPERPRRKQVPVDWDDLEMALTWRSDELEYFLDLRTGGVRQYRRSAFAGDAEDFELTEDEADAGLAEGYLVRVEPLESSVEYGWMSEFAASVRAARLRDLLEVALNGRGAFRRFKDVLAGDAAERERWFRFRDARVREAMREWLEDHDIEPTAEPPQRGAGIAVHQFLKPTDAAPVYEATGEVRAALGGDVPGLNLFGSQATACHAPDAGINMLSQERQDDCQLFGSS